MGRAERRGRGGRFRSGGTLKWDVGLNGQETTLWRDFLEERWLGSAWEEKGMVRCPWSF